VFLDEGTHKVVFRFRPLSFVIGATVSVLAILGALAAVLLGSIRRPVKA
jgi:hypothetical protein